MTDEYKTIEVERRGSLAIISMNRPDKLNALSMQLINDLHTLFCGDV